MILQELQITAWRCFLESVTVGPFTQGLNVIFGPNGTGKSTLFEALRRGLLDSHSVSGADVQAICPWGRELSPRVSVVFINADVRYRMTKQFLEGAFSRLERWESGTFKPLAENRGADERVRSMLTRNPPGRGLSQIRHWGLAQVLWAPQGNLALAELSDDLVVDIRNALGTQMGDATSGPLEKKITALYERFFTKQGKPKSGRNAPESVRLKEMLEDARIRRQNLRDEFQRFEETSRRVEELRAQHAQMLVEARTLTGKIQDLRHQADEYRYLISELEKRSERRLAAESQYNDLKRHITQIQERESEQRRARQKLADLEDAWQACRKAVGQRNAAFQAAKIERQDDAKVGDTVRAAETEATDAMDYRHRFRERDRLGQRVKQIRRVEKHLATRKRDLAELAAPDIDTLKRIRSAVQERDQTALLLDASMIELEIAAHKDAVVNVMSGEDTGERILEAGTSFQFKGAPEVVLDLKGVARIRAAGPTGNIEELRRQWHDAVAHVQKLVRPYGGDDLERLESLAETAAELAQHVREAQKELETLLEGRPPEALQKQLTELEAVLGAYHHQYPAWQTVPPDAEALTRSAAELKERYLQKAAERNAAWEKAQTAHTIAVEQEKAAAGRVEEARRNLERVKNGLHLLTADGKPMAEREQALQEKLLTWEAGRIACAELEKKLNAFEGDPQAVLDKQERRVKAVQEAARKARDDEMAATGQLEALAARGPYSVLTQVEEEISELTDRIQSEELKQAAIKLLHDTVAESRKQAMAAVTGPVEKSAGLLLQRIAGRRLGRIEVNDTFLPTAVKPEINEILVAPEQLSGGEQEQLHLSVRLALAEVLAGDQHQMVVLDDVLAATDAGRLARVMNVLEECAQRLQLLILTCHPERYGGLADANLIDLEAILRDSH